MVDDDSTFLRSLLDGLAMYESEFSVVAAESGEAALRVIDDRRVDVLVTDLRMPGIDGFELLRRVAGRRASPTVVVMTALGPREIGDRLADTTPEFLLEKPLEFGQLLETIRRALGAAGAASDQIGEPHGAA